MDTQEGRPADPRRPHERAEEVRPQARKEGTAVHQAVTSRRLDWPDCQNTRDLGGVPIRTGVTRSGVLIRSDSVGHLTEAGLEAMVAYGVTTVLDLRTDGEVVGLATDPRFPWAAVDATRPHGVRYLHRPLVDDVRGQTAPTGVGRYIQIVDTRQAAFGVVFNTIAEAGGPLLFHCFAGKDRTGIVAAMLLELAGASREDIAADYGETDRQLARQYEIWLSEAAPERVEEIRGDLCCPADRIIGVLEHVDRRWGGVASYLEAGGVSASNLQLLAARLTS